MRYALSAMAATSGLILLGVAFFGEPGLYLRQARQQWDALIDEGQWDGSSAQDPVSQANNSDDVQRTAELAAHMKALQETVNRLQARLAAQQAMIAQGPPAALSPGGSAEPANRTPPVAAVPVAVPEPSPPAVTAVPERHETAPVVALDPHVPPAPSAPERRETASIAVPDRHDPPPVILSERHEAAAAAPEHHDVGKPPVSPPLPKPAPVRQEAEDARTVLARLRQTSPGAEPANPAPSSSAPPNSAQANSAQASSAQASSASASASQASASQAAEQPVTRQRPAVAPPQTASASPVPAQAGPAQPPMQSSPSPSSVAPLLPAMTRVTTARAALVNGRVDEARRLLQEAQLLLVFRPIGTNADEAVVSGRGAADIAHALEALGGNDMLQSRHYMDRAIAVMSGAPVDTPERETVSRSTGYAPAYPPR